MRNERLRRIGARVEIWARVLAVGTILALAVLAPTSYVVVHHSSQPEFCKSCHIMDPYIASWEDSPHGEIVCIACHFDPGLMGTLQGKFQALTQLTKYVTRTAGTRPWAHVSDASCTSCHRVSELEGPLEFDGIAFDHGPHLALVNGIQLQCVTCHSHVLIDDHFSVQKDVCFVCHFMPDSNGELSPRSADCGQCHAAPAGEIEVEGAPFAHESWVQSGVDCRACHADSVAGSGSVFPQRCKSCHAQPELLAQIDSPDFLHRVHVSERKVECFECHVEISHGLAPTVVEHARSGTECGACHSSPHRAAFSVYAGTGALGVEDRPSRMLATKVSCEGCHSGRLAAAQPSSSAFHGQLGVSGEVDCLHCHGTGFAGMLGEWQGAVGDGLAQLGTQADELARHIAALPSDGSHPSSELLAQARHNIELLQADGSRGAHNVDYALEALRASAARIDEAWETLGAVRELSAQASLPPKVEAACASCHVDVARHDPLEVSGSPFNHGRHLELGLDCAACHVPAALGAVGHGEPAFPRTDCASCHHQESRFVPDPTDCSACHSLQISFLEGTLAGFEDLVLPMAEKGCENCHAEPPDLMNPQPALCVLCHEEGYDETFVSWQRETAALVERLEQAIATRPEAGPDALAAARAALALVAADGSSGVHAFPLSEALLKQALQRLGAE